MNAVGSFLLGDEIGRGGQAVVYRGVHREKGWRAAVKLLAAPAASNPEARARFAREARSTASLSHPNVLPVYEAGEEDGLAYIAMRYVSGGSLEDRLVGADALGTRTLLAILRQVGVALDHAHDRGVVHRDVKPANVLLEPEGTVYLADFGLSRRPLDPVLTPIGAWLGTPEYVAPEVLRGESPGPAADRYALALMAFECMTGTAPFRRETVAALVHAHLNEAPPRASDLRPGLGRRASGVLARGMAKRPDRRPGTALELVERLERALEGTPDALDALLPARRGPGRIVPPTRVAPTFVEARARPAGAGRRRRGRRLAIVGVAVVAGLGLVVGVRGVGETVPPQAPLEGAGARSEAVAALPDDDEIPAPGGQAQRAAPQLDRDDPGDGGERGGRAAASRGDDSDRGGDDRARGARDGREGARGAGRRGERGAPRRA